MSPDQGADNQVRHCERHRHKGQDRKPNNHPRRTEPEILILSSKLRPKDLFANRGFTTLIRRCGMHRCGNERFAGVGIIALPRRVATRRQSAYPWAPVVEPMK